jgi:phosphoribosylaminoimidazole (AIR) synthetase
MGIGYLVVVAPADVDAAVRALEASGERVVRLGEITIGDPGVELVA